MSDGTKTGEFQEMFHTAFDPPPPFTEIIFLTLYSPMLKVNEFQMLTEFVLAFPRYWDQGIN